MRVSTPISELAAGVPLPAIQLSDRRSARLPVTLLFAQLATVPLRGLRLRARQQLRNDRVEPSHIRFPSPDGGKLIQCRVSRDGNVIAIFPRAQ
jgi:hypothetical protein